MPNKYDKDNKDDDITKMVRIYQEDGLLFTGHPEHFPRGQKGYFSIGNYRFNMDFLEFRLPFCKVYDDPLRSQIKSGEKTMGPSDFKFFNNRKGKQAIDVIKCGKKTNIAFMCDLTVLILNLYNKVYAVAKDGVFCEKLVKDICDLLKKHNLQLDITKKGEKNKTFREITAEDVQTILTKFGNATSKTIMNFAYSRVFYYIFLCTLDVELDIWNNLDKPGKNETKSEAKQRKRKFKKLQDKGTARMETVSRCLAQLFGLIFEGHYEIKTKSSILEFILRLVKIQPARFIDMEENINLICNELVRLFGENGLLREHQ